MIPFRSKESESRGRHGNGRDVFGSRFCQRGLIQKEENCREYPQRFKFRSEGPGSTTGSRGRPRRTNDSL